MVVHQQALRPVRGNALRRDVDMDVDARSVSPGASWQVCFASLLAICALATGAIARPTKIFEYRQGRDDLTCTYIR